MAPVVRALLVVIVQVAQLALNSVLQAPILQLEPRPAPPVLQVPILQLRPLHAQLALRAQPVNMSPQPVPLLQTGFALLVPLVQLVTT